MSLIERLQARISGKTPPPAPDKVKETPGVNSIQAETPADNPTETKDSPTVKINPLGMDEGIIQNLTAKRLCIKGDSAACLVLAPLERERKLLKDELRLFPNLHLLQLRSLINVREFKERALNLEWLSYIFVPVFLVVLWFGPWVNKQRLQNQWFGRWFWLIALIGAIVLLLIIGFIIWTAISGREVVQPWAAQSISLLVSMVIGLGGPFFVIYFFGGGRELRGHTSVAMIGRILQLFFIATASFLPALLYFLFDRQQLGTLRDRFEQQIFRLDPNVKTLKDVTAKYGRQMDEIYGSETTAGEGRLVRHVRSPILVATVVITLGWILTLMPLGYLAADMKPDQLFDLFLPRKTVLSFGFLGAYFFALNTALRRYVRADLKPKAYSSITVRVFVVVILGWVLSLILPAPEQNPVALMFAFIVGVFPETGLTLIREAIRSRSSFGRLIPHTREKYPLTDLEEIDVYDRARLLDEGVTNIESLAHHDLIDLMLETRIPVPRLVDWIDQAILYLHVTVDRDDQDESKRKAEKKAVKAGDKPVQGADPAGVNQVNQIESSDDAEETTFGEAKDLEDSLKVHQWLRSHGVRTATDFENAYGEGKGPLSRIAKVGPAIDGQLEVLLATLKDDEWLNYVRQWRKCVDVEEECFDASSLSPPQQSCVCATDKSSEQEKSAVPADLPSEKADGSEI